MVDALPESVAEMVTQARTRSASPSQWRAAYQKSLSPAYGARGIQDDPGRRPAGTAETPRSRRTLPLPQLVGKALAKHIAAFPQVEDGSLSTRPTATGTGSSTAALRIFAPAVRDAGLPTGTTSHALVNR